jgi:hypothetical protein
MIFSDAQAVILTVLPKLSDPMTSRHHLVTMTNGKFLAKLNQRTINALIAFLVWIVFLHSTSCNAFVLGVQSS